MVDILARMSEVLSEQGIDEKRIVYIESKLRHEFYGGYAYVGKSSRHNFAKVKEKIAESIKTESDFKAIAKRHNVLLLTVYRVAKNNRLKK